MEQEKFQIQCLPVLSRLKPKQNLTSVETQRAWGFVLQIFLLSPNSC